MNKKIYHYDFFPKYKPGKARNVIDPFDTLTPQDRVFLVLRVSHRQRKSNLNDQDENLRDAVNQVGAKIVGCVAKATSGFDPLWLWYATIEAKKLGATVLIAETTDRFIRHPAFHSIERPDYQAADEQLAELAEATQGMKLITRLHPEASPFEVRSYQRQRGQRGKGNCGGRPRKRTYGKRLADLPKRTRRAMRHGKAEGKSYRQIGTELGLSKSQVGRYLSQFAAGLT